MFFVVRYSSCVVGRRSLLFVCCLRMVLVVRLSCSLFAVCCALCVVCRFRCSLFVVGWLLFVGVCLFFVVRKFSRRCHVSLFVVGCYSLLLVVFGLL